MKKSMLLMLSVGMTLSPVVSAKEMSFAQIQERQGMIACNADGIKRSTPIHSEPAKNLQKQGTGNSTSGR